MLTALLRQIPIAKSLLLVVSQYHHHQQQKHNNNKDPKAKLTLSEPDADAAAGCVKAFETSAAWPLATSVSVAVHFLTVTGLLCLRSLFPSARKACVAVAVAAAIVVVVVALCYTNNNNKKSARRNNNSY